MTSPADPAQPASGESATAAKAARTSRFSRLRKASDRVPTKWFAAIGTGLFLAATAAFGGLGSAPEEVVALADVGAGEAHVSEYLSLQIDRAVLIDELRGSGATPAEGERLLVLLTRVENLWDRPVGTGIVSDIKNTIRLVDDERAAAAIVREDDLTTSPTLQPDVPVPLAFTWTVPADRYAEGDTLEVTLLDPVVETGVILFSGEYRGQPVPAAIATIELEDAGAGDAQ
ncbi:hypothetical protein [Microbacterium sp. bgisy189]|uniref:hypothetical protein n=1 Tax=Microbacterium sp. bgisy189 TaxID=3413798 RepID=UPI003EC04F87